MQSNKHFIVYLFLMTYFASIPGDSVVVNASEDHFAER